LKNLEQIRDLVYQNKTSESIRLAYQAVSLKLSFSYIKDHCGLEVPKRKVYWNGIEHPKGMSNSYIWGGTGYGYGIYCNNYNTIGFGVNYYYRPGDGYHYGYYLVSKSSLPWKKF